MKKRVLILGGGVGGLRAAQDLAGSLPSTFEIVLVDRADRHVLRADLYEVATIFQEFFTEDDCFFKLKDTVSTPLSELIPGRVRFLQDEIVELDAKSRSVVLRREGKLEADFILVALGSTSNYFGVRGAKDYAFPLKTVSDALKLNCKISQLLTRLWHGEHDGPLRICVAGGGPTGVEFCFELAGAIQKLSEMRGEDASRVKIELIQSGDKLAGFQQEMTDIIASRMKEFGIKLHLKSRVVSVGKRSLRLKFSNGKEKRFACDALVWTCGVKVSPIVQAAFGGPAAVKPSLEVAAYPKVFAVGDNAFLAARPQPGLASVALKQGAHAAENILRIVAGRSVIPFKGKADRLILRLGGPYAVMKWGRFELKGFAIWVLRRLWILRYLSSVSPLRKAFKKWLRNGEILILND